MVKRRALQFLIAAAGFLLSPCLVAAAEVTYYLSAAPDSPPEQRRTLKTIEDDTVTVQAEAVARLQSDRVQEAVIVREEVESYDEEQPVLELFLVRLVVPETEEARLTKMMGELCQSKPGVHVAVDDVVVGYRPFAVCGSFRTEVPFTDRKAAEDFARKMSPKSVRFVEAPKG